jgi:hypothetical protein
MSRHVIPLGLIFLIPKQPVFALTPQSSVHSGEAVNFHFDLIQTGLESTIKYTRDEHTDHYITDTDLFYL